MSTSSRPLVYIGLVVVGLLAGILITLAYTRPPALDGDQRPVVETVDLGAPSRLPPVMISEELIESGFIDAMTLNEAFKNVAALVRPSVVFIEVESTGRNLFHRFERNTPQQSVGSGVIVSEQGYVVTNHHVIEDAQRITVTLSDKRQYEAEMVGDDPNTDLAVLRLLDADNTPAVAFGDSDALEVGEWVLAVGNPFRLTSTVTAGIVSAIGRQVNIIDDSFGIESFIQTDAAINPGNSGGALVNLRGELVGIATAIATESGSYEGYGFAVPVNLMQRISADLIEFGEVKRGYLGVEIWPIDAARARELELPEIGGVFLRNVRKGLAAYEAGLRTGDALLSIEGRLITEPNELQSAIALYRPNEKIRVEVWRDGRSRFFDVELFGKNDPRSQAWFTELDRQAQPPPQIEPTPQGDDVTALPGWGLGLADLSPRLLARFRIAGGAYVAFVEKGTPAFDAGVPRDAVIIGVGSADVASVVEASAALAAVTDESMVLRVRRRDGVTAFFEVDVPIE